MDIEVDEVYYKADNSSGKYVYAIDEHLPHLVCTSLEKSHD
jgi:hypothetical protein